MNRGDKFPTPASPAVYEVLAFAKGYDLMAAALNDAQRKIVIRMLVGAVDASLPLPGDAPRWEAQAKLAGALHFSEDEQHRFRAADIKRALPFE